MSCLILFCKNMNNKINMGNEVFLYYLTDVLLCLKLLLYMYRAISMYVIVKRICMNARIATRRHIHLLSLVYYLCYEISSDLSFI